MVTYQRVVVEHDFHLELLLFVTARLTVHSHVWVASFRRILTVLILTTVLIAISHILFIISSSFLIINLPLHGGDLCRVGLLV